MQWRVCHPLRCARSPFPQLATTAHHARRAPCPGHLAFTTISRPLPLCIHGLCLLTDRPTEHTAFRSFAPVPALELLDPSVYFPSLLFCPGMHARARRSVSKLQNILAPPLPSLTPCQFFSFSFSTRPLIDSVVPVSDLVTISEGRAGLAWRLGEEIKAGLRLEVGQSRVLSYVIEGPHARGTPDLPFRGERIGLTA